MSWELYKGWLYIEGTRIGIAILIILICFIIVIYEERKRSKKWEEKNKK